MPKSDDVICERSLTTDLWASSRGVDQTLNIIRRERSHMTSAIFLANPAKHLSSLKLNVVISLGEYINAVFSRIVIGTLDLKQFLPKFKYFF